MTRFKVRTGAYDVLKVSGWEQGRAFWVMGRHRVDVGRGSEAWLGKCRW